MGTSAGIGKSNARDSTQAGREAARQARAALGGAAPQLGLVFATSRYDQPAVLAGVHEVAGDAAIAGCSGEGVIAGATTDETDFAVAVLALRSDTLSFETFLVPGYSAGPAAAGAELARRVRTALRGDELGLLVFPDGLLGNCSELLQALEEGLPSSLPVVGGAAGESMMFERTWQYGDGEAVSDAVAAVLLRGRGRIEVSVSHGCTPIGLERKITRAEGAWVQEIDGQPAWSVFRQYLDGEPEDLTAESAVHLSVGRALPPDPARDYEPYIIRSPLGLDKATGAMLFPGGGMEAGDAIRLTRRERASIRDSARACAEKITARTGGATPAFVLQFDCAGRGKILFGSGAAAAIIQPLQEVLGEGTPWIGFHTYGEIAPIGGHTHYHNYTVALCAVYDQP